MDVNTASYNTRADCVAATIPSSFDIVVQLGYYAPGDRGMGTFRRVSAAPTHSGYFQSADGAYWEICDNHINVRALGAKGDGSFDDLPAFDAAYSVICAQKSSPAANATGGIIYIPWGNYALNGSWNLTVPNKWCEIYGDGFYRTRIFNSNSTPNDTIYCGSTAYQGQEYYFHDFMIDVQSATSPSNTGINVYNNAGTIFERIFINGTKFGIYLSSSYACTVNNCLITHTSGPAIFGADASFNAMKISGTWVFQCGVSTNDGAIKASKANGIDIHADVEGCLTSYQFEDCSGITIKGDSEPVSGGQHFTFSGTNYGINIDGMMLAPNAHIDQWVDNVVGMSINYCSIYNTAFTFGSNALNVDVGVNALTGTSSIAEPSYFNPSLTNSWTAASGYQSPSYKKTGDGLVKIRGTIKDGTVGQSAFALPIGYRPGAKLRFVGATDGSSGIVVVDVDGTVTPTALTGSISLDQIIFTAGAQ